MSAPLTIEEYARVVGAGLGFEHVDWTALAAARGITASRWAAGRKWWGEAIADAGGEGSDLAKKFRKLLREVMAEDGLLQLPFDAYVEIQTEVNAGVPPHEVYRRHGFDARAFTYASYCWLDRFDDDPRLRAYYTLRVAAGVARRVGAAERLQLGAWGPANLVRARRCGDCAALKVVAPVSSWVYCDYCAKLIDYDATVALADPAALDPDYVNAVLGDATPREFKAAVNKPDRAAYESIVDWMHLVSAEIAPADVSPRIRDAEYRHRLIEAQFRWDRAVLAPTHRGLSDRFSELGEIADSDPKLENILAQLRIGLQLWTGEAALLERAGVFEVHPDGFTAAMFVSGNASIFVRPHLAVLDDNEQQRLLTAAGLQHEFIEAPKVETTTAACSRCDAVLAAPKGAKRCICRSCGAVTEIDSRRFECGRCGALVAVGATGDTTCESCGVTWAC